MCTLQCTRARIRVPVSLTFLGDELPFLEDLKAASSRKEIAQLLGYKASSLTYILYKLPDAKKYTTFEIPKKSGVVRQICAPVGQLKNLQHRLARLLAECRSEIESKGPKRASLSHGFRKSHSIVTNAKPHKNRRYVLNLDIETFFPSINFGRVRGFFLKNKAFELKEPIATIIAQIACYRNSLPQGSPCSPIISDLIAHLLDVRLAQLAKTHKCTYSRYADDLTFSTNQKLFPAALAFQVGGPGSEWVLGAELVSRIVNTGFAINDNKTRMQCETSRQLVTGLTVNKKVNIRSEYSRAARAMCNSLFTTGKYHWPSDNACT
jgi:RNA-directed DNA polymerase